MSEVEILTPRGTVLAGTFVDPVDSQDGAVIFSHSYLCDRKSSKHFPWLAGMYRSLGYATLIFDYSGHGASGDDPIQSDLRREDLKAASSWLTDKGFPRQLLHGHSTGTTTALRARPPAIKAMFLTSAVVGPMDYDWEAIFSSEQLDELERTGRMSIPYDYSPDRSSFVLTSQSLIDLSLNSSTELLSGLTTPLLLVFDEADEQRGLVQMATEVFHLLPARSRLEVVEGTSFADQGNLPQLGRLATAWAQQQVPLLRSKVV